MIYYTIGIVFNSTFDAVLLIEKSKPDWQKGWCNFPGGKLEDGETLAECVQREIIEETGILIPLEEWGHIGEIVNHGGYCVQIFTAVTSDKFRLSINEKEPCKWCCTYDLPDNILSNLKFLVPFAMQTHKKAIPNTPHPDSPVYGKFTYKY